MNDANPWSARRWRAVFGRWPKAREYEKSDFSRESLGDAASAKELFGGPPNSTRGPRVLPRSQVKMLSLATYPLV
jgi:hypothetical protein